MISLHQPGNLWLIGGTSESVQIAAAIAQRKWSCQITVTTASAQSLYAPAVNQHIHVGPLTSATLPDFCQQAQICAIIDASHPFASQISTQAIAIAQQLQLPYLRFERPNIATDSEIASLPATGLIKELPSFEVLLTGDYLLDQRVLLTVGCKALAQFQPWQNRCTLFARILPTSSALESAIATGFTSERLLALRPPINLDLETALWQQWQISLVVTKASGQAGGEVIKRAVAKTLGIPLIVIARPPVQYPQQTSDIATVLQFCEQSL